LPDLRRSYAECCIDDVTASHAAANDCIVHFGHSCFSSQNQTKTTIYVVPKAEAADKLTEAVTLLRDQYEGLYIFADLSLLPHLALLQGPNISVGSP